MAETNLISKRVQGLHILAKQKVSSFLSGNRRSLFLGNGTEFSDLREYQTGDELRHIDWRATAKRYNSLIVRDFEVERNSNVVMLLDASASMLLGDKYPRMRSAMIAIASLAHATVSNKDFFGFGAFSKDVSLYLPPKGGKSQEFLVYKQLLELIPSGTTDLGKSLKQVATSLKRRSIILVLTDLHDNTDDMIKGFKIAKGFNHEVQVIQLTEKGEFTLPKNIGKIKFTHPDNDTQVVADFSDPVVSGIYNYEINKKIREINSFKRKLRGLKVKLVESYSHELAEKALLSYFSLKQRGHR
ncbi:MAG: DUF58 domain-containing protein [Candidatus Heimdallarchaeota archaeon]|nr:DUF58 domain-containing protein [Candidatus Heimdallarchaeota archaeon]